MIASSSRRALLTVSVVAVCLVAGCGKSPTEASGTNTQTSTVPAQSLAFLPVDILKSGTMTLTLTWTDSSKNLTLSLSYPNCTSCCVINPTQPGSCLPLAQSALPSGTREEIVQAVQVGDKFKAWVANGGSASEPFTLTATVR